MVGTAGETTLATVLREYVWHEPAEAVAGTAVARVRRGQVYVALVGVALWLGGLLGGILPLGGPVVWCLAAVVEVGIATAVLRPQESAVLTGSLIVTALAVLLVTRAQESGSPVAAGWFDAAAVSLIGIATLRRALVWAVVIGVTSLGGWTAVVMTTAVAGGWRSAVAWSTASVSLAVTSAVMAAIIRAGARRLDQTVASAEEAFSEEELQQAESVEFESAARVLHDSVINTLTAIGRGVQSQDVPALRSRCRQDLDLIDSTLAHEESPPHSSQAEVIATAQARAHALGVDLTVTGSPAALSRASRQAREAIGGAVGEALLNTAKHTQHRSVVLDVAPSAEGVVVTVGDTGPGWSGVVDTGGGIEQSIMARCQTAGVEAVVSTAPDRGTVVTMRASDAVASDGEAVFVAESRLMTAVVCAVLLVDMGIRTVLGEGVTPAWGSAIAYLLLVAAMVWPWVRRGSRPGYVAPLALSLVGLPVVLLLPIEDAALSWIWWGTIAGIAIFLALVAMNASAWWVLVAYLLQMMGRYLAADQTSALLVPDAVAVGLGALIALWIRSRVLRLMSATADVARERDQARLASLRREVGRTESLLRLRRATDSARHPLELVASGRRTGVESDVRAEAATLAPYLRNVARVGPGLGALGTALLQLLDSGAQRSAVVSMSVDPSVPLPERDEGMAQLLADTAQRLVPGASCTVNLLSRPGGGLLTVVTSAGAPSSQVLDAIRSTGMQAHTDADEAASWIEVMWEDRTGGVGADGGSPIGDMVP